MFNFRGRNQRTILQLCTCLWNIFNHLCLFDDYDKRPKMALYIILFFICNQPVYLDFAGYYIAMQ